MKYRASVDGREISIQVSDNGVWVDGEHMSAILQRLPNSARCHLRWNGKAVPLFVRRVGGEWRVELYGGEFRVEVEDERTRELRRLSRGASASPRRREVRAPMPGLVVRVEVEAGEEVQKGTGLVIMEAMKMENEIRAESPGRVTTVEVRPGETVERDQILLRLE